MHLNRTRRSLLQGMAGAAALAPLPRLAWGQDPYVLGTLFPMSGPVAELGGVFAQGVELALAHIQQDGLLSRPIVLRAQDSLATPQGGAVGMSRLVNVDRAPYVLLGVTGVAKAAAPIGARRDVVMVNGGGVSPDLAELSPYFWNLIPLADQEIPSALQWLKQQNKTRVALVYVDDPLGAAVLRELKNGLPGIGGELVGAFSVPPGMEQFSGVAARIRQLNPDAVYFASYGSQQLQIVKQLRDAGLTQQLLTYSIGSLPSVINLPEAEGLVFTTQQNDLSRDDPVTQRFIRDWRAKHQRDPSNYAQNYYNGTWLYAYLLADLEASGKPVTGEHLREALHRIKTFRMAGGDIAFNANGTSIMPIQVNQVKGGQMVVVR